MTSETGEGRFFASNLSKNGDVNSKLLIWSSWSQAGQKTSSIWAKIVHN